MPTNVNTAGGIVQGISDVQDYSRERPIRDARVAEANLVKSRAEAAISTGLPKAEADQQVELLQSQVKTMQAQALKAETFSAFDRYSVDSDPKHLNAFLESARKNPIGSKIYTDLLRLDPAQPNQFTKAQLGQMGVDNPDEYLAHPELASSKLIGTMKDGSQKLIDVNKLYQTTGYTEYMQDKQLKSLHVRSQIDAILAGPQTAETNMIGKIAKEEGISFTEAATKYYKMKKPGGGSGSGSAQERIAAQLMEKDESLTWENALTKAKLLTTSGSALERETSRIVEEEGGNYQETYSTLKAEKDRTNKRKQLDEAKTVRAKIDELAGGDYLASGDKDETTRRKIGPLVTELENLTGKELSNDDKKTARELRNLFSLGSKAGEGLTEKDVGFYDNTLKNVKKYFTDDATGVENTSAYSTFVNTLRHAFFGSALTATEAESFRVAAGSLKQQLGPVLAGLKTQLSTVQDQMKTIADMNDEHVSQYYMGTSLEHMDKVMHALDERIKLVSDIQEAQVLRASKPVEGQKPAEDAPPARPSLDDIFGAQ